MNLTRRGFFRSLAGALAAVASLPFGPPPAPIEACPSPVPLPREERQLTWLPPSEWGGISAAGMFKNHVLSEAIREAAFSRGNKFLDFIDEEPVVGPDGDRVIITRVRPLS